MARRGDPRWRGLLAGAATVLALVAAVGCGSGAAGGAGGGAATRYARDYRPDGSAVVTSGETVPVEMGDMYFKPDSLIAAAGASISLSLHNGSPIAHNFALAALGISRNVPPGGNVVVSFTAPPTGTYYFYCDVPGHAAAGMVGRLVVR